MLYLTYVLMALHGFLGLFLIALILLQRGRGGGLAGSFGGMGGQSAFGTKAGDVFTKITVVVAVIWILLACLCSFVANAAVKGRFKPGNEPVQMAPADEKNVEGDKKSTDAKGLDSSKATETKAGSDAVVPPKPGEPDGSTKSTEDASDQSKPGDEKLDDSKEQSKSSDSTDPQQDAAKPTNDKSSKATEGASDK